MAARQKTKLGFESLETRQLFSASPALVPAIANDAAALEPSHVPGLSASSSIAQTSTVSDSTRWDWLAGTEWHVPVANLLAYIAGPGLSDPIPVGDQTLWNIEQCTNGRISGTALVQLSISSSPSESVFEGIVTKGGQIRIEFFNDNGNPPTTGIGQMRFIDGAWTMEMQMATGSSSILTHWAYMAQTESGTTPPDADDPSDGSSLTDNWSWLEGTSWAITDKSLFGKKAKSGTFEIDSFHNGYFWGSGTAKKPFNVLGSVTPEGNLLLVVSVDGGTPVSHTGQLQETALGGLMLLRSYDGKPSTGFAVTIDPDQNLSNKVLTGSVLQAINQASTFGCIDTKQIKTVIQSLQQAAKEADKASEIYKSSTHATSTSLPAAPANSQLVSSGIEAIAPLLPKQALKALFR